MTTAQPANARPLDPVTFEVIRHRLVAITDEMSVTVKAVSGSPMVTDASDFNTALFMPDGGLVTLGRWNTLMAASLQEMAKHIIADCTDDPGIGADDQFIVNSPHKGALHAPDTGILAPIFWEGELVGWAGGCSHQLDVGGMEVSSVCPEATDIRQEGILIPPVKLVDGGKPRKDVWEMIVGMSRLPHNMSLDFKALISANDVAKGQIFQLIRRYGIDTLRAAMRGLVDFSEARVRRRLRELPDGVFRAVNYKDHDGRENRLYTIALEMTKRGEELIFDYSGSSPQSARFINCTEAGLMSAVYSAIFPILAYDVPWNAGAVAPMKIVTQPGLVVSASWPAPVSLGAVGVIWLAEVVAVEALSKMMACSPTLKDEAQANPPGAPDIFRVAGLDQYGEPFGGPMLDMGWMGEAAFGHRDGITVRGAHLSPQQQLPNAERIEGAMPLLYLYRRLQPDSGGPGHRRGGQSARTGYALHDSRGIMVIPGGHGFEVPNSLGLFGGYPGACNQRTFLRDTDLKERFASGLFPRDIRELEGEEQVLSAQPGRLTFGPNDAYEMCPMPGGGWGDPTRRDPELVAQDVADEVLSAAVAREIYGVALRGDGTADPEATATLRARIRADRAARPRQRTFDGGGVAIGKALWTLGEGLEIVETRDQPVTRCTGCGAVLAPAGENWKYYATVGTVEARSLGPYIRLHQDLEAREYACPGCGLLLALEITTHDAPPLWDIEVRR
jgi:N-methylhydantoinase B